MRKSPVVANRTILKRTSPEAFHFLGTTQLCKIPQVFYAPPPTPRLPSAPVHTQSTRMWTSSSSISRRRVLQVFYKEMRTITALRHPNIVAVLGAVVEAHQDPVMVMECMDRGSLYDILHNPCVFLEPQVSAFLFSSPAPELPMPLSRSRRPSLKQCGVLLWLKWVENGQ